jgi:hypothetical protein
MSISFSTTTRKIRSRPKSKRRSSHRLTSPPLAIEATLLPDAYTAVVRGKNTTMDIAVVEVYNLQ